MLTNPLFWIIIMVVYFFIVFFIGKILKRTNEQFRCPKCGDIFYSYISLYQHNQNHPESLICIKCKEEFWDIHKYNRHMREHFPKWNGGKNFG